MTQPNIARPSALSSRVRSRAGFLGTVAVLTLALLSTPAAHAQAGPTEVEADLLTWIEAEVASLPGADSLGYAEPDSGERDAFGSAVAALLAGDLASAQASAALVDYDAVVFRDAFWPGETLHALLPASGNSDGRGSFYVRPAAQTLRRLVVEAPHPAYEKGTAELAALVFRASGARALAIAGAHRCASTGQPTSCSGTANLCNGVSSYLISDAAHSETSFFHIFHELAANEATDTITLQLHGFNGGALQTDVLVSDGTTFDNADLTYLPNLVAADLDARILAARGFLEGPASSCNRPFDSNLSCGASIVQGRHVNGSANPCSSSATSASGRFLNLHLSRELRYRGGDLEPQIVVDSLLELLPEQALQGQIGDRVWLDTNGDGLQGTSEPALGGATVELFDASNNPLASTFSAADGSYLFEHLDAGGYYLRFSAPGLTPTSPLAGASNLDSNANETSGETDVLNLANGDVDTSIDAGFGNGCPAGLGGVEIEVLTPTPEELAQLKDKEMREQAHISSALAEDLGLPEVDPNRETNPQIRVVVTTPVIGGDSSSGNFTVARIFPDTRRVLGLYNTNSATGFHKLFETTSVGSISGGLANARATVYRSVSSEVEITDGTTAPETRFFCEPANNETKRFEEKVTVVSDKRFALFVPHGSGIELKTSDQIAPIQTVLAGSPYNVAANVWEGHGQWGSGETSTRWHITSGAIDPQSFPGLGYLLDHGSHDAGKIFRYVLSIHGFDWSGKGVIVGGHASREAKCLLVQRIEDSLASFGRSDDLAYYIHDVGGSDLSLPIGSGSSTILLENVVNVGAFAGLAPSNIANRFSPNPESRADWGGLQVEESKGLRTDESTTGTDQPKLREIVARGMAEAMGELLTTGTPTNACCTLQNNCP